MQPQTINLLRIAVSHAVPVLLGVAVLFVAGAILTRLKKALSALAGGRAAQSFSATGKPGRMSRLGLAVLLVVTVAAVYRYITGNGGEPEISRTVTGDAAANAVKPDYGTSGYERSREQLYAALSKTLGREIRPPGPDRRDDQGDSLIMPFPPPTIPPNGNQ